MYRYFPLFFILGIAASSISACRVNYFLHPLPVDSRNRTCVPPSLRGKYLMEVETDQDSLLMLRKSIIYLKPRDTLDYHRPYTVEYNTVTNQVDTTYYYKTFGSLLFTVDPQTPFLVNHWPYTRIDDTLRVIRTDSVIVDLGYNCFFRKVKRHTYILNYHTTQQESEGNWWQPVLFRWNKKGITLLQLLPENADSLDLHFYNQSENYYYNLQWTAKQIDSLIRKGELKEDGYLKRLR